MLLNGRNLYILYMKDTCMKGKEWNRHYCLALSKLPEKIDYFLMKIGISGYILKARRNYYKKYSFKINKLNRISIGLLIKH